MAKMLDSRLRGNDKTFFSILVNGYLAFLCHSRGSGNLELGERMDAKQPAIYILASKKQGTLYIGVTSDLVKRAWEHKNDLIEGFTKKYHVHILVYFELHTDMYGAITREKNIKKWNRQWKLDLIEKQNPLWQDLYEDII